MFLPATTPFGALFLHTLAQSGTDAAGSGMTLGRAAYFFGYFLLVMALLYGALLLTRWIGRRWGKTANPNEEIPEEENTGKH